MKATAIIVAAGLGKRLGGAIPKQFQNLLGQPLLAHTLSPFEVVQEISEVIVLLPGGWEEHCRREIVEKYGFKKVSKMVSGGKERQDSVYQGLKQVSAQSDLVLVHDGVRPLVTRAMIEASLDVASTYGAAIVAVPLTDTIQRVGSGHIIKETLNREGLWLAQTPQTFRREILLKAFEAAFNDGFCGTDDASVVERAGFEVRVVPGAASNIKVTTPEDLRLAEMLLREGR
jgi:2-C-methyl-D-erythritol 4-phosphate cytidylyltransferase